MATRPDVGQKGTVAARLDRQGTPWGDIEALIRDACALAASRCLAERLAATLTAHPKV